MLTLVFRLRVQSLFHSPPLPSAHPPWLHICKVLLFLIQSPATVSEGMGSLPLLGTNHLKIQRLKITITSYSSSCICSSWEGSVGRAADLGSVSSSIRLGEGCSWTALFQAGRGWASLGQLCPTYLSSPSWDQRPSPGRLFSRK